MKHLMTLLALVVAVTAGAQGTTIHEYPWNPDWNNDNYVGSSDLTGFLSAFGSEFGNPPEPCDYDGTEFGEFISNVLNSTIIIDSVFIEFELEDVSTYYLAGCPDPITDTVIVASADMHEYYGFTAGGGSYQTWRWYSYGAVLEIKFFPLSGQYSFKYQNALVLDPFVQDGFFDDDRHDVDWSFQSDNFELFQFDENGLDIPWTTGGVGCFSHANYLHILPYWHYAE